MCGSFHASFICSPVFFGEGLLSPSDTLLFPTIAFQSVPPRCCLPVMHNESCFALTLYFSWSDLCVVPSVNVFKILWVNVAASNLVVLLNCSFFKSAALGSGVIINFTHLPTSLGKSFFLFDSVGVSRNLAVVLNCIIGLIVAFMMTISYASVSVLVRDDILPDTQAILLCATLRSSNNSMIISFWS